MDYIHVAYGALAEVYIERFGSVDDTHPDDLAFIEAHLASATGPVIDVGCGPGHHTEHLRSLGVGAVGFDLVPAFLRHATASSPDARYGRAAADRLPVPDGAAAGVLAWYSLIHLRPEQLDPVLIELRRVIAPGGALVVGIFEGPVVEPFDHRVITAHRWPLEAFVERLSAAGLQVVDRLQRPGDETTGRRAEAAITAVA